MGEKEKQKEKEQDRKQNPFEQMLYSTWKLNTKNNE